MKLSFLIPFLLTTCMNQKEKLIGQQAVIKQKMDSVEAWKGATYMLLHEWRGEKEYDSVRRTVQGREYFIGLQKEYERYDSVFKHFSKQYDSMEVEIQNQ